MARIFRIIMPVSDIERAGKFYGHLLGQPGERVSAGRHYFNCEGVVLACVDPVADGDDAVSTPNPEPVYLAVVDLAATFQACQEAGAIFLNDHPPGVGPLGEITRRPWGEESFYVRDPFGNALCFVSAATTFTGDA